MDDTNIKALLGDAYREGMTNDEIVEALNGVTLPLNNSDELDRMRKAKDKANSEAAEYKRQLKAKMTEDEQRAAEEAEKYQKMQEENETLKKQIALSDLTTKFIASGLDAESAAKSAEAAYSGDFDTVINNFTSFVANSVKTAKETAKAELLDANPIMQGGRTGGVKDNTEAIQSSIAMGDYANAAALMRQQETQNNN